MNRFPFEELRSPMEFQQLCAELLELEGCQNIRGLGTGSDLGKDVLVDIPLSSPIGYELQSFIIQCKWYKQTNNVGQDEIGDLISYISLHRANGILIITSSDFTGTAVNKMDAINEDPRMPYRVKYWNGATLSKLLCKYPKLIKKYWYKNNSGNTKTVNILPDYNFDDYLQKYAVPPLYSDCTMDTFPRINENLKYMDKLFAFYRDFYEEPNIITIIDGAIGAGKTGYAWALLNQQSRLGKSVAGIHGTDFNKIFFDYILEGNMEYPLFLRFLEEVDFLLIDDFGFFLSDASDSQKQVAEALVDVCQQRKSSNKPVILTVHLRKKGRSPILQRYLEYISYNYEVVYVGDADLRMIRQNSLEIENNFLEIPMEGAHLGKAWLEEKYDSIISSLESAINTLVVPEENFKAHQKYFLERYGTKINREQEVYEDLKYLIETVEGYKHFIESLDFESFYIKYKD